MVYHYYRIKNENFMKIPKIRHSVMNMLFTKSFFCVRLELTKEVIKKCSEA
jgi:hypothetical protein